MFCKGDLVKWDSGIVGIVMGERRHGHQYDRRWEYEILQPDGSLKWWDEYDLYRLAGMESITSCIQEGTAKK